MGSLQQVRRPLNGARIAADISVTKGKGIDSRQTRLRRGEADQAQDDRQKPTDNDNRHNDNRGERRRAHGGAVARWLSR